MGARDLLLPYTEVDFLRYFLADIGSRQSHHCVLSQSSMIKFSLSNLNP